MIFPLKNTHDLYQKAADLSNLLSQAGFEIPVLRQGSIGQRYKRADAIGVPYIFTLDEPGLNDDSLTLRERDTRVQVRITTADIAGFLSDFKTNATIIDLARKLFELGKSRG
jgi:glycyl-tRNA synthetase